MKFQIDFSESEQRLDKWIKRKFLKVPQSLLEKFSRKGKIKLSGKKVKLSYKIKQGDVIVIRNSGPKGGPGMPEMLKPTSAVVGAGLNKDVALITDGRFSGGSHGFVVGHISPESFDGGPIAIVKNGDIIKIDSINNKIELKIDNLEFDQRIKNLKLPTNKYNKGVVKKYINTVSSASKGCVTD